MSKRSIVYTIGRGPWLESVAVGVVASAVLLLVGTVLPFVCYVMAPICLVIGLLGMWRRK